MQGAVHDELYAAMDWLLERQPQVEQRLAARHLKDGELALYDSPAVLRGAHVPAGAVRL